MGTVFAENTAVEVPGILKRTKRDAEHQQHEGHDQDACGLMPADGLLANEQCHADRG